MAKKKAKATKSAGAKEKKLKKAQPAKKKAPAKAAKAPKAAKATKAKSKPKAATPKNATKAAPKAAPKKAAPKAAPKKAAKKAAPAKAPAPKAAAQPNEQEIAARLAVSFANETAPAVPEQAVIKPTNPTENFFHSKAKAMRETNARFSQHARDQKRGGFNARLPGAQVGKRGK